MDSLAGLPGLAGTFEDVDDGVLGGEDVVVALGKADSADVVLDVDAGETEVGEGGHGGVGGVVGEAGDQGLHGVIVGHWRLVHCCWRLDEAWHTGVLGHGEAAGGVGWWGTGVVAVHCVVASVGHGGHSLRHCGVCWLKTL